MKAKFRLYGSTFNYILKGESDIEREQGKVREESRTEDTYTHKEREREREREGGGKGEERVLSLLFI